jgi:hypothetical protein
VTEVIAELRNDLLRLQAEYVNYRRRVERDRDVARDQAVIGVINSLMPVLDDIDAARQHGDLADGPFAAIAGKFENALKAYELTRIDETGVAFDPNIHEALIQQPSPEVQADSVSQVLRAGYRKGDRVPAGGPSDRRSTGVSSVNAGRVPGRRQRNFQLAELAGSIKAAFPGNPASVGSTSGRYCSLHR